MGSMKDLYTRGVTDLESYNIGYQDAEDRIIELLKGDEGQKIMCLECSDELIALIKGEK